MSYYDKYLGGEYECSCNNTHKVITQKIIIEKRAIYNIPALMDECKIGKNVFVVCDENTYDAAGEKVIDVLNKNDMTVKTHIFSSGDMYRLNEHAIGTLMLAIDDIPDVIIAVGSGTINDICRFCAMRLDIDYFTVATAPSMDGYMSGEMSAMFDGTKKTYNSYAPKMVVADLNIISKAPMKMIAAGFSDMMAKVTSRLDWMIGHLFFEDDMCKETEDMINMAVGKSLEIGPDLSKRSDEAIGGLTEALMVSGLCAQMSGNINPIQGAEHIISDFLDIQDKDFLRPCAYHGAKAGMATLIVMRLYEKLFESSPPPQGVVKEKMELRAKLEDVLGKTAEQVLKNKDELFLSADVWAQVKAGFIKNWDLFKANVRGFDALKQDIIKILNECDGPVKPQQLGYTRENIYNAIIFSGMISNQPTILTILANWGYLDKYAHEVLDEIFE